MEIAIMQANVIVMIKFMKMIVVLILEVKKWLVGRVGQGLL